MLLVVCSIAFAKPLDKWETLALNGVHLSATGVDARRILGQPKRRGGIDFVGRRYERWTWEDGTDILLSRQAGTSVFRVERIIGHTLSEHGRVIVRKGDAASQAQLILGEPPTRYWGRDIRKETVVSLTVHTESETVVGITLQLPYARPAVPLEGEASPVSED